MRKTPLLLVPMALLGACTWGIHPDDAARNVRTAWNDDVSACRNMGKVTVTVMDHVGPVDRNDIKVRDELEVLARNEAAKLNADTVKPLAEPTDGSQAWGAYQCGANLRRAPSTTSPSTPSNGFQPAQPGSSGDTKTYPIKGG